MLISFFHTFIIFFVHYSYLHFRHSLWDSFSLSASLGNSVVRVFLFPGVSWVCGVAWWLFFLSILKPFFHGLLAFLVNYVISRWSNQQVISLILIPLWVIFFFFLFGFYWSCLGFIGIMMWEFMFFTFGKFLVIFFPLWLLPLPSSLILKV